MNKLSQLLSNEISYAIGWTIIHSLWQCTLIALLIAISYAFTKKASAATRYWINSLGLLSCFIASITTFYLNYYDSVSIEIVSTAYITEISSSTQQAYVQTISDIINQHINQIVMVWLIGFALYMSKYLAEFFYCQHIKNNHYKNPNQQWQQLFNELKNSVGITQNIQLRLSEIVDIPCVVGHFKPVVLLPASLVLGLSIKHIEVILLHELGHVRRNDYLISSVQTLITLLYFFNPFARWISSKMDEERENACDDIAVAVSGDPLFYANTLKEFAEMKDMYSPAVAMTGRKNLLINRIKRLFIRDASFTKTYGKAITIMAMFLLTIGYSVAGYSEEKKPTKDTFSIKIENEPLSQLLTLVEQHCPGTAGRIKLKHPSQSISGTFTDLECYMVESRISALDNSLDSALRSVTITAKGIPLRSLVSIIETSCPETRSKIQLKNPETFVDINVENLPCKGIEEIVNNMDTNQSGKSITTEGIRKIEFSEPSEYSKAFFKELSFPKDIVDKGYAGDCTLILTVDTNGVATDITPACTSPNKEQKQYFENLLTETAKRTAFPIKLDNEKAVIAKGISIKAIWRNKNITSGLPSTNSGDLKDTLKNDIKIITVKNETGKTIPEKLKSLDNSDSNYNSELKFTNSKFVIKHLDRTFDFKNHSTVNLDSVDISKIDITTNSRDVKKYDNYFINKENENRNRKIVSTIESAFESEFLEEINSKKPEILAKIEATKLDIYTDSTRSTTKRALNDPMDISIIKETTIKADITFKITLFNPTNEKTIAELTKIDNISIGNMEYILSSSHFQSRAIKEIWRPMANTLFSELKTTLEILQHPQNVAQLVAAPESFNGDDFTLGLSVNSDVDTKQYNKIKFEPLSFSKKLIIAKKYSDFRYTSNEFGDFSRDYLALLNREVFKTIENNELNKVPESTGDKTLTGEIYIYKILPHWKAFNTGTPSTTTSSSQNRINSFTASGTEGSSQTEYSAKILVGVVLKDTQTQEVVAVLKDQFTYAGSRMNFKYMSEKRKKRIIKEDLAPQINEIISKATTGLTAHNQEKKPSTDGVNHNENLISKNM